MLKITIPGDEFFDEENEEFLTKDDVVLELEHSLVSLSKWESIWEKPYLGSDEKSTEEVLGYVEAMILTPEYPEGILQRLSEKNFKQINDYLNAKMTATWFNETKSPPKNSETITSELIYYWMTAFSIPMECESWHLNRLFTLIKICSLKQEKPKKMSRSEIAQRNRELNEKRRAQMGTRG